MSSRTALATAFLLLALAAGNAASAQEVVIPGFFDPRARLDRPDLPANRTIRFLTNEEFPPLHFAGPGGVPTGFAVELARAVCERLRLTCTVQARRFDTLLDALAAGEGDVVAAAIPIDQELRRRFLATNPYFRFPARFAARKGAAGAELRAEALAGKRVAVVRDTAHEAFLRMFFPGAEVRPVANLVVAQGELRRGEVDYVFADGLALALWLGGTASEDCCAFAGGPYTESRFFGEGVGYFLRAEDAQLARGIDYAMQRLWEEGRFAELYLRFFPVSPF